MCKIMRLLFMSVFLTLTFVACNNTNSEKEEMIYDAMHDNQVEPNIVGSDVDEHGCKGSAGYTWSKLRGDCIRIFEEGSTLLAIDVDESEAVFAAFILYSDDETQLELFLPSEEESILLDKIESLHYETESYLYNVETKTLYIDGEASYIEDGQ